MSAAPPADAPAPARPAESPAPPLSAGQIEAAFHALPPEQSGPLLARLNHHAPAAPPPAPGGEPGGQNGEYVPRPLSPEAEAELARRIEEHDREPWRSLSVEQSTRSLSESLRRVAAGEDPDVVRADMIRQREAWLEENRVAHLAASGGTAPDPAPAAGTAAGADAGAPAGAVGRELTGAI